MKKALIGLGVVLLGLIIVTIFFRKKRPIVISNNPNVEICKDTFLVEKIVFRKDPKSAKIDSVGITIDTIIESYYCNQIVVNFEELSNTERQKVRKDTLEKMMGLKPIKRCPCSDIEVWGTEGNLKIDEEDRKRAKSSSIAQNSGGKGKNLISSLNLALSLPSPISPPSNGDIGATLPIHNSTKKVVKVALLDSGIDDEWGRKKQNPIVSLQDFRWRNPDEIRHFIFNIFKKDCFLDDLYGYDFTSDTGINIQNHRTDNSGHGTHIAGIIAGINIGKEYDTNIQIMDVKIIDPNTGGDLFNYICGLEYARQNGAKIFNSSIGAYTSFQPLTLKQVLGKIDQGEGLVIASAGNDGLNNDKLFNIKDARQLFHIPSDINNDAIISVASLNYNGKNLPNIFWMDSMGENGTNYGTISIDVAAPGEQIASSHLDNKSQYLTGTSMATGQISRVAAILDNGTDETNDRLKNCIIQHANTPSSARLQQLAPQIPIGTQFGIVAPVSGNTLQNCLPPTQNPGGGIQ